MHYWSDMTVLSFFYFYGYDCLSFMHPMNAFIEGQREKGYLFLVTA